MHGHKNFHTKIARSQRQMHICIHHSVINVFKSIQPAYKTEEYLIDSYKLLVLILIKSYKTERENERERENPGLSTLLPKDDIF